MNVRALDSDKSNETMMGGGREMCVKKGKKMKKTL
jgi:hypothetical protein